MRRDKLSGRVLFRKLRLPILGLCIIAKFLPNFFKSLIYNFTAPFDGKIAALIRYILINKQCQRCGDNVLIGANVTLKKIHNLSLGNNISIHNGCYLDAEGGIVIDDDTSIAHHSSLISFEHTWDDSKIPIKYNPVKASSIHVKSDVWIGCGVRILSGVTIGSRSVVAAGAVVTKDVQHNSLVAGVPAKLIKNLSND